MTKLTEIKLGDKVFTLLWLALTTFALGPAGGMAFASTRHVPLLQTAVAVTVIHVALVPVWFGIFELVKYSLHYENRFVAKFVEHGGKKSEKFREAVRSKIQEFERRVGQRGFGLGVVGFTFLFGVSWAALASSLLNLKKETIIVSVAVGAIVSSLFWALVFAGFVWLSPWVLYLIGTILTFTIIGHKKLRERKLIRKMCESLRKIGIRRKHGSALD